MPALLFGSISTLADTSELQRDAFNQAFAAHGLDWQWDQDQYRSMLTTNGGRDRIAEYARTQNQTVDAEAIHNTKSKVFQESLGKASLTPRPGVVATIAAAKQNGWQVGLVTTTSRANIAAVLDGLSAEISRGDFDLVVDSASVGKPKPDPECYVYALRSLHQQPNEAIAVEDNIGGVSSATAAGVACVAFPNANTAEHDFGTTPVVEELSFADLQQRRLG